MQGVSQPDAVRETWGFLSEMGHANLRPYLNFMCSLDELGEIVHPVVPARHEAADALVMSFAAWDLARAAAAVCAAHPHLDDGPTVKRRSAWARFTPDASPRGHSATPRQSIMPCP